MTAPATPPEGLGVPLTRNAPGFSVDAIYSKNDGQIYTLVNGVEIQLAVFSAAASIPVHTWGAENVGLAVDTRVMPPGYSDGTLNTNTPKGFRAPRAGTFRNLTARHNAANGNGNAVVYRLRVNGVLTALQVSLATGAIVSTIDAVNTVAVVAGDLIEMTRSIAVGIGSAAIDSICAAEFA